MDPEEAWMPSSYFEDNEPEKEEKENRNDYENENENENETKKDNKYNPKCEHLIVFTINTICWMAINRMYLDKLEITELERFALTPPSILILAPEVVEIETREEGALSHIRSTKFMDDVDGFSVYCTDHKNEQRCYTHKGLTQFLESNITSISDLKCVSVPTNEWRRLPRKYHFFMPDIEIKYNNVQCYFDINICRYIFWKKFIEEIIFIEKND